MGKTRKRGGSRRKRGGFAGVHDAINTLSANIHKGINVTDAELRKAKENLKKTRQVLWHKDKVLLQKHKVH